MIKYIYIYYDLSTTKSATNAKCVMVGMHEVIGPVCGCASVICEGTDTPRHL